MSARAYARPFRFTDVGCATEMEILGSTIRILLPLKPSFFLSLFGVVFQPTPYWKFGWRMAGGAWVCVCLCFVRYCFFGVVPFNVRKLKAFCGYLLHKTVPCEHTSMDDDQLLNPAVVTFTAHDNVRTPYVGVIGLRLEFGLAASKTFAFTLHNLYCTRFSCGA